MIGFHVHFEFVGGGLRSNMAAIDATLRYRIMFHGSSVGGGLLNREACVQRCAVSRAATVAPSGWHTQVLNHCCMF
jgi:hypothetical protein